MTTHWGGAGDGTWTHRGLKCCCVVVLLCGEDVGSLSFTLFVGKQKNQHADTVGLQLKHNYNGTFCQISHLSNIVDEIPSESEDFLSQYWLT